jgi:hypothetical protein
MRKIERNLTLILSCYTGLTPSGPNQIPGLTKRSIHTHYERHHIPFTHSIFVRRPNTFEA